MIDAQGALARPRMAEADGVVHEPASTQLVGRAVGVDRGRDAVVAQFYRMARLVA